MFPTRGDVRSCRQNNSLELPRMLLGVKTARRGSKDKRSAMNKTQVGDPRREGLERNFRLAAADAEDPVDYFALLSLLFGMMVRILRLISRDSSLNIEFLFGKH